MGEALKRHFGQPVIRALADQIRAVQPGFNTRAFIREAVDGFDALELMPRGLHLARVLRRHLPQDEAEAIAILCRAARLPRPELGAGAMAAFFYLPHVTFVAEYGLPCFEASMQAQHELTQRFSAEFSIRAFLEHDEARTLARLHEWTRDPSEHVRRLVSEGTRPRLPWARRLRRFQKDPTPVLALLETLKDDPSLYVRRSVANNLNDIGRDHPAVLLATAARWMADADQNRRALVSHALRSLVKAGDLDALAVLGFGHHAGLRLADVNLAPARVAIGGTIAVTAQFSNPGRGPQAALVDMRVHFVKADGDTRPKTFKLGVVSVPGGGTATLRKTISLRQMTTRRHYPGLHRVDFLVNGRLTSGPRFEVVRAGSRV